HREASRKDPSCGDVHRVAPGWARIGVMATEELVPETVHRVDPDAEVPPRRFERPRASQLVPITVLVLGSVLTAASFKSSWVHLAYHLPRMHAIIDTTIGLVSLLLAYLVYSRAQALGRQRDYMLVFALGFGGFVNLFAALTQGVASVPLGRAEVWTTMIGRLDVALLFAAAAWAPDIRLQRLTTAPRFFVGL